MLIAIVSQPDCEQCMDQRESFYDYQHLFLRINFNIILLYKPRSLRSFMFSGFPTNISYKIMVFCMCAKRPARLVLLNLTILIMFFKDYKLLGL